VPVSVTLVPAVPVVGVKPVRVGGRTVKFVALVAVPAGVVTCQAPVGAPTGTVALIVESSVTLNDAATLLSVTDVAPVKPLPVRVTVALAIPAAGVKPVIAGAFTITVKLEELVPVPPAVVTLHGPLAAVAGTTAVIEVAELTV